MIPISKPKNTSGPKIQRLREAAGLTRDQLAKALRRQGLFITSWRIRRIEGQRALIYDIDLAAFAAFFQVKSSTLLD